MKARFPHSLALLLSLVLLPMAKAHAQSPNEGGEAKELKRSAAFGLFFSTHGSGLDFQFTRYREKNHLFFGLALGSCHDLSERKIRSAYADQKGKDYVWDKKNYLYTITPTIGLSRTLLNVGHSNRLAINGRFSGGPLLGLLKPYYVIIAVPVSSTTANPLPFPYDASLYTYDDIVGEGDLFMGFDELRFTFGARLNAALQLDFSANRSTIRALEFGIYSDFYPKRPEILDVAQNSWNYTGFSVAVLIGNKH